ncbi:MAG: hypothetical protein B1H11_01550 [Desulfobacteraceae bacterium 4484_190.1]|nr:MAG: hypothetical protein B1H11_01550 [Desulfobacteraceae bacterium 4484_190.1]
MVEKFYNKFPGYNPNQACSLHILGVMAHQMGKQEIACSLISRAIARDHEIPQYYNDLALVLSALGKPEQAIQSIKKALLLKPDFAEAFNNLGNLFMDQERALAAIKSFHHALKIKPDFAEAHFNMGNAFNALGRNDLAIKQYILSIKYMPDNYKAYNNLGNILRETGRVDEAVQCYQHAIGIRPESAVGALNNMGNLLRNNARFTEAILYFKRALAIDPNLPETYNNLGNVLKDQGNLKAAEECYKKTIRIDNGFAEAHFNLSIVLLLTGNFEEGWKEYESRLQRSGKPVIFPHRNRSAIWDGSPFPDKRLLVYDEQGLGDTLQFIRYLPMVKAMGGTIIFETREPFYSLLEEMPYIDELWKRMPNGNPDIKYDIHVPLLSLPMIFGTTLHSIPDKVPYLKADPVKSKLWGHRIKGEGLKIGVVWAGSPTDTKRSCNLNRFDKLIQVSGTCWYGLQKGSAASQMKKLPENVKLINLGEEFNDFSDTAAVIANLDLIISIDTSVAHLAGAMGKPVWLLLPLISDWRWLLNRKDSPWYPTMTIFRQQDIGDWDSVIYNVGLALHRFVKTYGIKPLNEESNKVRAHAKTT